MKKTFLATKNRKGRNIRKNDFSCLDLSRLEGIWSGKGRSSFHEGSSIDAASHIPIDIGLPEVLALIAASLVLPLPSIDAASPRQICSSLRDMIGIGKISSLKPAAASSIVMVEKEYSTTHACHRNTYL